MAKVSILIPIFNVEKYLDECLESVVNQTLKDIEIICIDDGSTDSSPEIIKKYADKDSRIKVITKKNSGYGDSMNKGLAKATGEYIGIVESDDFVEPNMFEDLYKLAKKHSVEVVKSEFYYYFTDLTNKSPQWDKKNGGIYSDELREYIVEHNTKSTLLHTEEIGRVINPYENQHILYQKPAIWSAIYSRQFLLDNDIEFLPTPGASYQDTGFSFKVWSTAKRAYFTNKAYLHYRQDNEASSVNSPGKVFCVADEYAEIEKYLNNNKLWDKYSALVQVTKYGAYMWNFNRLAEGLDEQFLEVFSRQFKMVYEDSTLDPFYFDINQRRDLREIIYNPKMFLARKWARKNAKVSVIVPVYNTEQYLNKCLDSLLNQTLSDIEIICVNDGSPDDSISILEEYHSKDARVNIVETVNGGPSAARNIGMSKTTSNYVMFCDSDDFYDKNACKRLFEVVDKSDDIDIVIAGISVVYTTPELKQKYSQSDKEYFRLRNKNKTPISNRMIKTTDVSPCNKLWSLSLIKKYNIRYPVGLWYEDSTFFTNYMLVSKNAYFIQDYKMYNYVRRDDSIMSTTAQKTSKAIDHVKAGITTFEFMKKNNLLVSNADFFIDMITDHYRFSTRYMPDDKHHELHALMRWFIARNKSYLDSIDPVIVKKLGALPPERTLRTKVKSRAKQALKKPANKLLPLVSPTYRQQGHLTRKIDILEDNLRKLNKQSEQRITNLELKLDEIINKLNKK